MTHLDALVPPEDVLNAAKIANLDVTTRRDDFATMGESMVGSFYARNLLTQDSTVLDIGCGIGRLARPLTKTLSPNGRYYGFEINRGAVEWCQEAYAEHANFRFEWIDLHSKVYNDGGRTLSRDYRFPLPDNYVDLVILASVFTHMMFEDQAAYLREIARMLKPGGRTLITYFLIDAKISAHYAARSVSGDMHPVMNGYIADRQNPEAVVLMKEPAVLKMYADVGLHVETIGYGVWANHQGRETGDHYQDDVVSFKPLGS